MRISRRDFLKYCVSSAAVIGLDGTVLSQLEKAFAAGTLPTVIWLAGASCTGCVISLANRISPTGPTDITDLLVNYINLAYHPNLMASAGDMAVQNLRAATQGPFILAVEGGIPSAFGGQSCRLWHENGREVTALEAVKDLSSRSIANLAIGTCASFGGIPAAGPNPTQVASLKTATGKAVINIPGCPIHPDWVVWTIAQLLAGTPPTLDSYGRPATLFQGERCNIHENCPRHEMDEVSTFGVVGCLKELGCRGPETQGDCPTRKWNNGTNWCVNANGICIGCTEQTFPRSTMYRVQTKTAVAPMAFAVNTATWSATTKQLAVSGTGKIGSQVVIKDPANSLLASRFIARNGSWNATIMNPPAVPTSVTAISDEKSLTATINGSSTPATFAISSAAWVASALELRIAGTGPQGAAVTVKSGTGTTLGTATINSQSNWALVVKSPNPVPSAITATSGGQTLTANVANAPVPQPTTTLRVTSAQYNSSTRTLTVAGEGTPGKSVSIYNASSGSLLGKTTVSSNAKWTKNISISRSSPSRVRVTSNGATAYANVSVVSSSSHDEGDD